MKKRFWNDFAIFVGSDLFLALPVLAPHWVDRRMNGWLTRDLMFLVVFVVSSSLRDFMRRKCIPLDTHEASEMKKRFAKWGVWEMCIATSGVFALINWVLFTAPRPGFTPVRVVALALLLGGAPWLIYRKWKAASIVTDEAYADGSWGEA